MAGILLFSIGFYKSFHLDIEDQVPTFFLSCNCWRSTWCNDVIFHWWIYHRYLSSALCDTLCWWLILSWATIEDLSGDRWKKLLSLSVRACFLSCKNVSRLELIYASVSRHCFASTDSVSSCHPHFLIIWGQQMQRVTSQSSRKLLDKIILLMYFIHKLIL